MHSPPWKVRLRPRFRDRGAPRSNHRGFQQRQRLAPTIRELADKGARVEAIDWYLIATVPRVSGTGATWKQLRDQTSETRKTSATRPAYFPEVGGFVETAVIDRYAMEIGRPVKGPALIEEREATTVVLPGDTAMLTANGHLTIEIGS